MHGYCKKLTIVWSSYAQKSEETSKKVLKTPRTSSHAFLRFHNANLRQSILRLVESAGVAPSGATPFLLSVHTPQAAFAVVSDLGLLVREFVETKGLGHCIRRPYDVFTMVKEADPSYLQVRCRIRRFKEGRTLVFTN
uniref:Uncharacterized protein n=1 Tax=Solanum tuberosum TaxID=4113 RepID=M1CYQ3_SOLTU